MLISSAWRLASSFDRQAAAVAEAWNYHIHDLRHVRKLLTDESAPYRACSIAVRLDYCNAVLYGAMATTLNKLQRVQNNLARAVCRRGGRADARPLLKSLHWHPLNQRIYYTYKHSCTDIQISLNFNTAIPLNPLTTCDIFAFAAVYGQSSITSSAHSN